MDNSGKTLDEKVLEERKAVLKLENGQYKVTAYGSAGQVLEERTLSEEEYQRNLRRNRRIEWELAGGALAIVLLCFEGNNLMHDYRLSESVSLLALPVMGGICLYGGFFERISGNLREFNNLARKYQLKTLSSH